jgi:hypothetical protein
MFGGCVSKVGVGFVGGKSRFCAGGNWVRYEPMLDFQIT